MLLAFPIALIGDMPQQQKNSGMKTRRAYRGCRFRHINSDERGGTHWYQTYSQHHINELGMQQSTFDPCLLMTPQEQKP